MASSKIVIWSVESSRRIEHIKEHLRYKWSEKEVEHFLINLKNFERVVKKFPMAYPTSASNQRFRKAVISKHNSVVYEVDGDFIRIYTILDNFQDNRL